MSIRIGDRIISGSGGAADGESLINQNTSSSIEKVYNWVGTIAEYEEQDVANAHPDWVCYILDDEAKDEEEFEVYEISGRNVGDIFFTSRKDLNLSGAVECDGSVYSLSDYEGVESVEELLKSNKLPYVSISEYNTLLETNESVGVFGWDGINASTFRVPTLNEVFIESGKVNNLGEFIKPGLPNITGSILDTGSGGTISYESGALYGATIPSSYRVTHVNDSNSTVGIGIDASRSSNIYGNSTTVQPQSVCYRPMVQLATGIKEESIYNIENHALFDNRITNCITHIPQDIKLEQDFVNNKIIVKAGTVTYYPNGFEEDGTTPHFDKIVLDKDYTDADVQGNKLVFTFYNPENDHINTAYIGYFAATSQGSQSGTGTIPTVSTNLHCLYYKTDENKLYWIVEDNAYQVCFPLYMQKINAESTPIEKTIKDVFNGFGFVGEIIYSLPGVSGLIPNGRNEDGSLNNIEFTMKNISLWDNADSQFDYSGLGFQITDDGEVHIVRCGRGFIHKRFLQAISGLPTGFYGNYGQYIYQDNKIYRTIVENETDRFWRQEFWCEVGTFRHDKTHRLITEINVKDSFKSLDYSDRTYLSTLSMPSGDVLDLYDSSTDSTAPASDTKYTAIANGYFTVDGYATSDTGSITLNAGSIFGQSIASGVNHKLRVSVPVRKSVSMNLSYSGVTITRVRFTYTEGSI